MDKQLQYIQAIRDIYPAFKIETVQFNQQGQFNDILLVNNLTVFRFPKTPREAAKLVTETVLLRSLQSRVTLPIPNPLYQSQQSASIGQIFMGYPLLPGEPLWPERLNIFTEEQLQHVAYQLATFLRHLHTTPAEALAVKLPFLQGCEEWQALYDRFRSKLFPIMRPGAHLQVTRQFEDFLSDARNCTYVPALVHGDFGPGNILYDTKTRSISGIIDFSSVAWGDPAIDFAAILCSVSYGEQFLERFAHFYPGIETAIPRARFYAGTFALQEALYGLEDRNHVAFETGIAGYQ